jgi:CP family cyanate transporter-like MFS transporter
LGVKYPIASAISVDALILLAINLRPALTGVGPLIGQIRDTTAISGTQAGLLTSLPIVALGAFAPLGQFARRYGVERTVVLALLLITVGTLLRSAGSAAALFGGSACLACGIAIGNTLVPGIIKRNFPQRVSGLTTVYAMLLGLTAAIGAALAVPLAKDLPGGWRSALAFWAIPSLAAALVWLRPAARARRPEADAAQTKTSVWRSPLAWLVGGFMGLQSLFFYVAMAWFPAYFQSHGYSLAESGLLVAYFQAISLVTSAGVPWMLRRSRDQKAAAATASLAVTAAVCGMLFLPRAGYVWMTVMGMGAGVTLPVGLAFMSLRAGSHREAASLSVMSQTVGYLIASTGPFIFGWLHELSGAWSKSLLFLIALGVVQIGFGLGAGRDRTISRIVAPSGAYSGERAS